MLQEGNCNNIGLQVEVNCYECNVVKGVVSRRRYGIL